MADSGSFSTFGRCRLRMVMQTEAAECALACLTMIACYHGHEVDLASLRRRFSTSLKGVNLSRLIEIAHALGFEARPLRAELEYLPQAQMPCVLHWNMNHFVVLSRITRKGAEIYDPARGRYRMPLAETSKHFTGVVLELVPGTDFSPIEERQRVSLRALTGRIPGLSQVLIQVFGLAFAIEALTLVMPFQMQWVIDQVLLSSDRNLLMVMTQGFLIVVALQGGANDCPWLDHQLAGSYAQRAVDHEPVQSFAETAAGLLREAAYGRHRVAILFGAGDSVDIDR